MVKLNAQLSFYDETTQRIPSQVRECVFDVSVLWYLKEK